MVGWGGRGGWGGGGVEMGGGVGGAFYIHRSALEYRLKL